MLSIGRMTAGAGYEYLTREVATARHDYYAGGGEKAGRWWGDGLARLGLAGEVTTERGLDRGVVRGLDLTADPVVAERPKGGDGLHRRTAVHRGVRRHRADAAVGGRTLGVPVPFAA